MDLLQLRYFKKVAELENMTRAAEELIVAQPAISKMIHQLESELECKLFDRVGRNIKLNNEGMLLLAYTNDILDNVDRIYRSFRDGKIVISPIHFSVPIGSSLIPKILSEFNTLYPEYHIIINTSKSINPIDIELFQTLHEIHEENACTVLREEIVLAVPKDHSLAEKDIIDLNDIKDYSIIGPSSKRSYMQLMQTFFDQAGFHPKMTLEIDNPETLRKLINIGYGISFVPKQTWIDTVQKSIKFIHINSPKCYRYINLRWKKGYLPENIIAFRDYLLDFFEKLQKT